MRGKARDILILWRITDFSTTGSAGLKRRNNGRNRNKRFQRRNTLYLLDLINTLPARPN